MVYRPNRNNQPPLKSPHRRSQSASGTDQIPRPLGVGTWAVQQPLVSPVQEQYRDRTQDTPDLSSEKNPSWNWEGARGGSSADSSPRTPNGPHSTYFPAESHSPASPASPDSSIKALGYLITSIIVFPFVLVRYTYRHSFRALSWGGRRAGRMLDPVLHRLGIRLDSIPWLSSSQYRLLPTNPSVRRRTPADKITRNLLWFIFFVIFLVVMSSFKSVTTLLQPPAYAQGLTYPVNIRDPNHHIIYQVGFHSSVLNLSPDEYQEEDIYRIDYAHPHTTPPVPVYKYMFFIKQGYEGKTSVYQSVARNNTPVVIKRFFRSTRSDAVPREVRTRYLQESQTINMALTGHADWSSGLSVLMESEDNFWGWEPKGIHSVDDSRTEEVLRRRQMEWPVEIKAGLRKYTSFQQVMDTIQRASFSAEALQALDFVERQKNAIEMEQEEGEIIQLLDVFYTPDFEITKVDPRPVRDPASTDPPSEYELLMEDLKPPKPATTSATKTATGTATGTTTATATKTADEGKETTDANKQKRELFGFGKTPKSTVDPLTERKTKNLLRNLKSDIESWTIALPFMEGGDVDHMLIILPLLGLTMNDLDWLYRPLFTNGVWKSLARMHHTKEDYEDRIRLRSDIAKYKWYTEYEGRAGQSAGREDGTHGIPKVRRPGRLDDYDEGYCHCDVKLDNIFIRRVPEKKRKGGKKSSKEKEVAVVDPNLPPLPSDDDAGTKHFFILSDLSQTRAIHHRWFVSHNYRDCRITDADRAWRSYLHLLRMGSRTRPDNNGTSVTARFDDIWMKWRQTFIDNDGRLPKTGIKKAKPTTTAGAKSTSAATVHQKRADHSMMREDPPEDPEAFISSYFQWLSDPSLVSSWFLPSTIHTNPPTPNAYWTRKLPDTRVISIAGKPPREMTRSQVFAAIDVYKAEAKIIQKQLDEARLEDHAEQLALAQAEEAAQAAAAAAAEGGVGDTKEETESAALVATTTTTAATPTDTARITKAEDRVKLPPWFWEPGGADMGRPQPKAEGKPEVTLTPTEKTVSDGLQVIGVYLLGM